MSDIGQSHGERGGGGGVAPEKGVLDVCRVEKGVSMLGGWGERKCAR